MQRRPLGLPERAYIVLLSFHVPVVLFCAEEKSIDIMKVFPEGAMEYKGQPLHASASEAITNNVRVEVESQFVPDRSAPFEQLWHFIYTVRITNEGDDNVQLISRHWIITDATGHTQEVRGPGVVGEQPLLHPGESFQYTSNCELSTSTGVMKGTYQMVTEDGDHFDVEIAPFALHEPYTVH